MKIRQLRTHCATCCGAPLPLWQASLPHCQFFLTGQQGMEEIRPSYYAKYYAVEDGRLGKGGNENAFRAVFFVEEVFTDGQCVCSPYRNAEVAAEDFAKLPEALDTDSQAP